MVGWHHWLDGYELEQALGVGDGPGSLACSSPWGSQNQTRLSDWTELNWTVASNLEEYKYLFLPSILQDCEFLLKEVKTLRLCIPHTATRTVICISSMKVSWIPMVPLLTECISWWIKGEWWWGEMKLEVFIKWEECSNAASFSCFDGSAGKTPDLPDLILNTVDQLVGRGSLGCVYFYRAIQGSLVGISTQGCWNRSD